MESRLEVVLASASGTFWYPDADTLSARSAIHRHRFVISESPESRTLTAIHYHQPIYGKHGS